MRLILQARNQEHNFFRQFNQQQPLRLARSIFKNRLENVVYIYRTQSFRLMAGSYSNEAGHFTLDSLQYHVWEHYLPVSYRIKKQVLYGNAKQKLQVSYGNGTVVPPNDEIMHAQVSTRSLWFYPNKDGALFTLSVSCLYRVNNRQVIYLDMVLECIHHGILSIIIYFRAKFKQGHTSNRSFYLDSELQI